MKWFQVLLSNTNYSIQHVSFICALSNGSKYCFVIPIILFCKQVNGFEYSTLIVKWFQELLCITNNLIKHQFTHCQTVLFLTIWFTISHFFCTQLKYQTDRTQSGATTPNRVELGSMAIKRYSTFPKVPWLKPHSLWESYSSAEMQSVYFTDPEYLFLHAVITKK